MLPTDDELINQLNEYESEIRAGKVDPFPYNRLMIAYRKDKNYRDELRVINRGIDVFEKKLKKQQKQSLKGNKNRAVIEELSYKINKQTGLTDKKGMTSFIPEPLSKWYRRKEIVEEKIKKQKASSKQKK